MRALKLIVPSETISHTRDLQFIPQQRLTTDMRRQIVATYVRDRQQYTSRWAFVTAQAQRLRLQGYVVTPRAIDAVIYRYLKKKQPCFLWERLLAIFRQKNPRTGTFWYDAGDLCVATGIRRVNYLRQELFRLRRRGYVIRKCLAPYRFEQERGWPFQYRLVEAQSVTAAVNRQ